MLPARGGQRREVVEEIQQHGKHVVDAAAALQFLVVAAEHLLGQLEHAGEIGVRQTQHRQNDVQRVVDGDVLGEVEFRTHFHHLVDVDLGQFVAACFQRLQHLWPEPVGSDLANIAMVRIVHVDQGAQTGTGLDIAQQSIISLGDRQQRARKVGEQIVLPFDVQDVGVLGDRPERSIVAGLNPGHRRMLPQVRERLLQPGLIGIGRGFGQDPSGWVADPVVGACAHRISCAEVDGCQISSVSHRQVKARALGQNHPRLVRAVPA